MNPSCAAWVAREVCNPLLNYFLVNLIGTEIIQSHSWGITFSLCEKDLGVKILFFAQSNIKLASPQPAYFFRKIGSVASP